MDRRTWNKISEDWQSLEKEMAVSDAKGLLREKLDRKLVKEDAVSAGAVAGVDGVNATGDIVQSDDIAKYKKRIDFNNLDEDVIGSGGTAEDGSKKLNDAQSKLADAISAKADEISRPVVEDDEELAGDVPPVDGAAPVDGAPPEGTEDVILSIMQKFPGAVITLVVEMPPEAGFDADTVAAAQEVSGQPDPEGAEMYEAGTLKIWESRLKIREMFEAIPADEPVDDAPVDGAAPAAHADAPGTEVGAPAEPKPQVEVSDTKIAMSPEQWEAVLATTDMAANQPPAGTPTDTAPAHDPALDGEIV